MFSYFKEAEHLASVTCEECGEQGRLGTPKGRFWMQTLCEKCKDSKKTGSL